MTKTVKVAVEVKSVSFKLIEGADNITKAIKSLETRGKKYEHDLHSAAVAVLNHVDKHGDITLANRLVSALGKSIRANALKDWFIKFGKLTYNEEKRELAYAKDAVTMLEEAIKRPFWLLKANEGGEYKPFDINAAIQALLKRADKAIKEHGDNVPADKLQVLRQLVQAETAK